MREIKFRGKRLENGEWAYGNYIHFAGDGFEEHHITSFKAWEDNDKVDPATVGQFTGLHDKNGKEIYEGDIIEDILTAEKQVIEFHGNAFTLVSYKSRFFFTVFRSDEKQIIGNIYDNPELLEGER